MVFHHFLSCKIHNFHYKTKVAVFRQCYPCHHFNNALVKQNNNFASFKSSFFITINVLAKGINNNKLKYNRLSLQLVCKNDLLVCERWKLSLFHKHVSSLHLLGFLRSFPKQNIFLFCGRAVCSKKQMVSWTLTISFSEWICKLFLLSLLWFNSRARFNRVLWSLVFS